MNIDNSLVLFDSVVIGATATNSKTLDLGAIGAKVPGKCVSSELCLTAQIVEAVTVATAVKLDIQTSDTLSGDNLANPVTLASAIISDMSLGSKFPFSMMPNGVRQYLQLVATPTGTPGKGKIFAALTMGQMING